MARSVTRIASGTAVEVALHVRDAGPARDLLGPFEALRRGPTPWLLDSALPGPRLGRFSFAGSDPWAVLRARGRELELTVRRPVHPGWPEGIHRSTGDPLAWLRALLPRLDLAEPIDLPFVGGAVGYFGYELAEQLEPVRLPAPADTALPDLGFLLVDSLLAFDHAEGRLFRCGIGFGGRAESAARARVDVLEAQAGAAARSRTTATNPAPRDAHPCGRTTARARHDADGYARRVRVVKQAIADGEVYQACFTHRLETEFHGDPWRLYGRLRRLNPAPFAAYLGLPEGAILSSSPERFLCVSADGFVEARPIKGTSDCGTSAASAALSRRALAASAKDRAENVMIVDLYRNDLGRVCETGSISVPELCVIERYGRLHQMVSTVTGRLAPGRDRLDLVRAAFPPGSMTGAPKIAAMRLLAQLEPLRRGVYAGALGYLDLRGGMDLSVVIRTLLVCDGVAHVHAGGGIVADSEPLAEHREAMDKARALLEALGADPRACSPGDERPIGRPAAGVAAGDP